jgi:hypothetical protein
MSVQTLIPLFIACCLNCYAQNFDKPLGCYSSMLTGRAAQNPNLNGGLVRTAWAKLEPEPGRFDFAEIERQLQALPKNKNWSLAVYAGWISIDPDSAPESGGKFGKQQLSRRPMEPHSPPWMVSELGIETFACRFRDMETEMPKYWDPVVQKRLAILMQALADEYKDDPRLKLIYVPQMTSNGIEGHFNGVPHTTLLQAAGLNSGETDRFGEIWVSAALSAIRSTANAFDNKAVAFELHELLGSAAIPEKIMNEILDDPTLKDQVGIGMWWISGKTDYQADLIRAIEKFSGDVYGQVIGRSDQNHRFPGGEYAAVFEQAKQLGMRYIEPWNYEFENHTHDDLLEAFNRYCEKQYSEQKQ